MENQENELLELAKGTVKKLKEFYVYLFVYLIGVIVFVLKEYFGVPFTFFPLRHFNSSVMTIWSIAFFILAIDALITFRFFGKNWQERKIKSIMDKKSKTQIWK
jgi:hypothetical protein